MDFLKKYFPYSFKGTDTVSGLVIRIIIFLVADIICGAVIGILGKIPVINIVTGLLGGLVSLYFFVSIILAILNFFKVLK